MAAQHFEASAQQLIKELECRGCDLRTALLTPIPDLRPALKGTMFEGMDGDELIIIKHTALFQIHGLPR
jgi:hypothetical protein